MNHGTSKRTTAHCLLPTAHCPLPSAFCLLLSAFCLLLFAPACMVGQVQRPSAPVPAAFKETPPADWKEMQSWKPAQPSEAVKRGKWWEIYNDPELNALEEQVSISNQNVKMAEAQYREARFAVKIARSNLFPTVSLSPTIVGAQASNNAVFKTGSVSTYDLPVNVTWEADTWGSVRRSILASKEAAQASDAVLENARLSSQAELARIISNCAARTAKNNSSKRR